MKPFLIHLSPILVDTFLKYFAQANLKMKSVAILTLLSITVGGRPQPRIDLTSSLPDTRSDDSIHTWKQGHHLDPIYLQSTSDDFSSDNNGGFLVAPRQDSGGYYDSTGRYISYGALQRNGVPCSRRGSSYNNCRPEANANPYSRGCSAITGCPNSNPPGGLAR